MASFQIKRERGLVNVTKTAPRIGKKALQEETPTYNELTTVWRQRGRVVRAPDLKSGGRWLSPALTTKLELFLGRP